MEKSTEIRRDRFLRVVPRRVNAILKNLQLLGNCSSRVGYSYTINDVTKIFSAIERQVEIAKERFQSGKQNSVSFSRDDLEK